MFRNTELSSLVRSENKPTSLTRVSCFDTSLALLWVVGRFSLVDLLLHDNIEECQVVVKSLALDLALSQRNSKDQVFTIVDKLSRLLLQVNVLLSALLYLKVAAVIVVGHDLLDVLVWLVVESVVQLG